MKLAPGSSLGPYEILAPLGAGGMGEVYSARDTRLGRTVAVKVLSAEFTGDARLKIRFENEAKAISALSHPHICALYDVGPDYLVMEYCEGTTLAERIMQRALPTAQVIEYGIQIADALEKAHRAGIIHRDLKPSNIMITKSGLKLLDFGLAKQHTDSSPDESTAAQVTEEGKILGTTRYMAPELLDGKKADPRSDIFALGLVVYEMAAGKPAFSGTSRASLIAAILDHEPPPLDSSAPLDRLVRMCLAKDPDERWQCAGDLKRELQWMLEGARVHAGVVRRSGWSRAMPWAFAGLAVISLVFALLFRAPLASAPAPTTRITLSLSRDNSLTIQWGVAISPDGRTIAFAARSAQGSRLYIRRLDEWEPRAVPSTENGENPLFSPDGRWIAFSRKGNFEKVPVSGGPPQLICKVEGNTRFFPGCWRNNGTVVFAAFPKAGLWRVSSDGGTPQLISRPGEGSGVSYLWPETLPGDRGILLTVFERGRTNISVLAPGTDKPRILVETGSRARYLPTGHLVYVADGHLMAIPFDTERLEVRGGATVVADDMNESTLTSVYDVSTNGVLVYLQAGSPNNIVWRDRRGATVPIGLPLGNYSAPVLSADGQRLAVNIREGPSSNIWTGGVAGEPLTRLTFGDFDFWGLWSRDGARLFYTAGQNGTYNIFSIPANGSGKAERLTQGPNWQRATSLSPSGETLLFNDGPDVGEFSLSSRKSKPVLKTRFNEGQAVFSPDGRWIAYESDESGHAEVYVQAYPGPGVRRRVSLDGGDLPFWSHTGRELFYSTATAMFAVPVVETPDLRMGAPLRLFALARLDFPPTSISADDKRFLMLENANPNQSSQLNLVQNWFEDLKARVPVK